MSPFLLHPRRRRHDRKPSSRQRHACQDIGFPGTPRDGLSSRLICRQRRCQDSYRERRRRPALARQPITDVLRIRAVEAHPARRQGPQKKPQDADESRHLQRFPRVEIFQGHHRRRCAVGDTGRKFRKAPGWKNSSVLHNFRIDLSVGPNIEWELSPGRQGPEAHGRQRYRYDLPSAVAANIRTGFCPIAKGIW